MRSILNLFVTILICIYCNTVSSEQLTIPGPVCNVNLNGHGQVFGAFDMTTKMSISFDISLSRGEHGSSSVFRIQNTAGRTPIEIIAGGAGGPHTRLKLIDSTGVERTLQCGVYQGSYNMEFDGRIVTFSNGGNACGTLTLPNDLIESNLRGTSFNVYGGYFSAGPCTNIQIETYVSVSCGALTIPGPVGNGDQVSGRFDMASDMSISFDISLIRGEHGSSSVFRIQNAAGRTPIEIIAGGAGGPHTRLKLSDSTGVESVLQCGIYQGSYNIVISGRTVTFSNNGNQCGTRTLPNDLIETNLLATSFNVYGGYFSAGPCTNILVTLPSCAVDECAIGTANCDQNHATCTDTPTGFLCECNAGYNSNDNGVTCDDVDECAAQTYTCDTNAKCINTDGSYECACNPGFSGNGLSCTDNNECADGSHTCDGHATCTNTQGSYQCECNGPRWVGNGYSCQFGICNLAITALYDGTSVDLTSGIWTDRSGNGNDGTITGSGGNTYDGLDMSDVLYLRDQEIFYGKPATHVEFPMTVTPRHSVINLCKYNGATKRRIVQSSANNIVFGFWGGKSGVAHYLNTWLTDYNTDRFGDNWVLSIQSNTQYYANGVKYSTTTGPEVAPGTLGINYGHVTGEYSDFACAEVIIINDVILNDEQVQCFEEHFNEKYGFDIVAPETEQETPVKICDVAVSALYDGDGINFNTHSWSDRSGNGNEARLYGSGGAVFNQLDPSNSLYLNDRPVFYGTPATRVSFPITVTPRHTIMNLCKYNGATKKRILQSSINNIIFGFHFGKTGVAFYQNKWITDEANRFGDQWVLSIQSNTQYYANGVKYSTTTGPEVAPGTLGINYGQFPGEYSDFACAEILVVNDVILPDDKVQCFEDYFADKYAFDIVAPEFTEPVSICNVPITALYDTDGIHLKTHTWADSSGNGNDAQIYGGGNIFDKLDTSNPLYLNDRRVFYGKPSTNVRFPVDVSAQHTVLNVCKYNGASRRRILQSSANNIVFGFHWGRSGVAHYL
eukprot:311702_1